MKLVFCCLVIFAIAAVTLAAPEPNPEADPHWRGGYGGYGGYGGGYGGYGGGYGGYRGGYGGWGREGGWGR